MFTVKKDPNRDFVILNFADPQLSAKEWRKNGAEVQILVHTVTEAIKRAKPDLITVLGDISWGPKSIHAYQCFADFIESFSIPWVPIWGNHDHEVADPNGPYQLENIEELLLSYPNCLFEKGDPALGSGNFVVAIQEEEKIAQALIFMDSRYDRVFYLDGYCNVCEDRCEKAFTPAQIPWYRKTVEELKKMGCPESTLYIHMPFYGYRTAFYEATEEGFHRPGSVSIEDSYRGVGWKEEYKSTCFGVNWENIASQSREDGFLDAVLECNHTKNVIVGHCHENNSSVLYRGVRLSFCIKLGIGCEGNPKLNGGSVFVIGSEGAKDYYHEYVDVSNFL